MSCNCNMYYNTKCYCKSPQEKYIEEYDEFNYNASDEFSMKNMYALQRDEFIFTQVFNNYNITTKIPMDLSIGTIEDWVTTCDSFNKLEKELHFAKIYIVENVLVCNNIHPFQEINSLTELFSAHIIHN